MARTKVTQRIVPKEVKKEVVELLDSSDDKTNSLNTVYGLKLQVSLNKILTLYIYFMLTNDTFLVLIDRVLTG